MDMDIHAKSVDMDMDMDEKFHIHGNPGDSIVPHGLPIAAGADIRFSRHTARTCR